MAIKAFLWQKETEYKYASAYQYVSCLYTWKRQWKQNTSKSICYNNNILVLLGIVLFLAGWQFIIRKLYKEKYLSASFNTSVRSNTQVSSCGLGQTSAGSHVMWEGHIWIMIAWEKIALQVKFPWPWKSACTHFA